MTTAETEWRKLDRRTVVVSVLRTAGLVAVGALPAVVAVSGRFSLALAAVTVGPAMVLIIGAVAIGDDIRWRRTSYRIGAERVELVSGIVVRKRRSLATERIRSVDVTAGLLLRVFGLAHVKIGTGEQTGAGESSLSLHPVAAAEGERLRRELLDRPAVRERAAAADGTLSRIDPSWIRFAPVSVLTPAIGGAAFGAVLQVAEWFGMQEGVISWTLDQLRAFPLVVSVLAFVAAGLVVGVVGSLLWFVEMWWDYRLEREPGGTLRVRRGLLTTRSVSLEERRLRGVEVVEPLGNRLLGAGRVDAVATGLSRQKEGERTDTKTLQPAAPRAEADRVAALVLREEVSPTASVRLRGHPRAARGRRVRWALLTVLVAVAPLLVLGLVLTPVLLHLAWICALVLTPVAVAIAFDAYRNLGHGITGGYLVARHGAVRRSTVALQRRGVIGWTARQSIFQRRRGLLTLTATTAAGGGAYSVHDVGESEGLTFAEEAVPDLFGPFLERT
ncbi:putative membrane protein [Prauserella shujinwangii]|uniref:Putative membrane protein n=1 Tax=Prauserella shujinwangii TaxID=1453103 RepID=A0A2T0M2T6_9PSEU|nr:PH domain-containing protein [Prauserella shujinwangii]PRX51036.1 putative membrane protein [Prauserella shujinwangii]